MFSQEPRCVYGRNPLGEVICQLRFPEILSIETELPAKFQEAVRGQYPLYSVRKEQRGGADGRQTNNYQFSSEDGNWRINLSSTFISLSCSDYSRWETFAAMLDQPLAAFIQIYRPACFERVGLRYINLLSRTALGLEGTPFRELITPRYLGLMDAQELDEDAVYRNCLDAELSIGGGCRLKLHAGPGKVAHSGRQDPEVKFILDYDLFMNTRLPVNFSAGALQTLHAQAYCIFRDAITERLHEALLPQFP